MEFIATFGYVSVPHTFARKLGPSEGNYVVRIYVQQTERPKVCKDRATLSSSHKRRPPNALPTLSPQGHFWISRCFIT